jgi:hypothetical protein
MLAVLKHTAYPSCGHRRHFTLPAGKVTPGHNYTYVCPETGARTSVRPLAPPEPARYAPQGTVQLTPAGEAVAAGRASSPRGRP